MPLISRVLPGVVGVRVVEALASTSHSTNIAPDASEGLLPFSETLAQLITDMYTYGETNAKTVLYP